MAAAAAAAPIIIGPAQANAGTRRLHRGNVGKASDLPPPIEVPELRPHRFDASDKDGIRAHLSEHGFVCVKEVASEADLERARALLWQHLGQHGWTEGQPRTYTDDAWEARSLTANNAGGNASAGTMGSTAHCEALWYVRSLPAVMDAYATACGCAPSDLIASFDRMSINRPASCMEQSVTSLGAAEEMLDARRLHTHFGQDGGIFNGDEPKYYSILSLYDMNKRTGATSIVPGSHTKVTEINEYVAARSEEAAVSEEAGRLHSFKRFTSLGLTPGVVNSVAGDLLIFNVSLFHGCCNAADPYYTDGLLRAICIMAMCKREMCSEQTLHARRRAYELDEFMGGQIGTEAWAETFLRKAEEQSLPEVRSLADASPTVQRLVCGRGVQRPQSKL
jgi:hypothetical protein